MDADVETRPKVWNKCFSLTRKLDFDHNTLPNESLWTLDDVKEINVEQSNPAKKTSPAPQKNVLPSTKKTQKSTNSKSVEPKCPKAKKDKTKL